VANTLIAVPHTQLVGSVPAAAGRTAAGEQETQYFGKAAGHVAGTVPAEGAGTRAGLEPAALARPAGEQGSQCFGTVAGPVADTCSAALAAPAGTRAVARTALAVELAVGTAGLGAGIAAAGTPLGLLQHRLPSSWVWRW